MGLRETDTVTQQQNIERVILAVDELTVYLQLFTIFTNTQKVLKMWGRTGQHGCAKVRGKPTKQN